MKKLYIDIKLWKKLKINKNKKIFINFFNIVYLYLQYIENKRINQLCLYYR